MREVIEAAAGLLAVGREVLFCQVVETKGSTPQKAGASMLVDPDGGQVGTLGGGCVEAEVKQRAIRCLGRRGAELHSFLLDHDYAWADGLICGGKMVILAEALRGDEAAAYFRALRDLHHEGRGLFELVNLDAGRGTPGARWAFGAEGGCAAALGASAAEAPAWPLPSIADRPRPAVRDGVAILPTLPRVRLLIVGAGHVGQAVADLAAQADFDVWVVDDRRQYANAERFPRARRILVGPIEQVLPGLEITPQTYALIVTRGHGHDQEALYYLAPTAAPYVGLIGSRRKIRMIFDGLRGMGVAESALARVSAPVGLDIGSESVPEIAVSIVAELIARRNRGSSAVAGNAFARPDAAGEPIEATAP
jgi:xanthine dehydrogenase accessory factor